MPVNSTLSGVGAAADIGPGDRHSCATAGREVAAEQPGSQPQRLGHREVRRPGVGDVVAARNATTDAG